MRSPALGVAHDDVCAGDSREVVEVQRLPELEHHEVRDVDQVVDRALTGQRQAKANPRRRRADAHVRKALRDEAAAVGRFQRHT